MTKKLLVLSGPTGVGKTAIAIQLANHYHTAIVNCDSRQFYKEISIGTAKPTSSEMEAAPHHLFGHLGIQDHYTVADYEKEGLTLLGELFQTNDIVILCGGSGLFVKALCEGLDERPAADETLRERLQHKLDTEGAESLAEELRAIDPGKAATIDLKNPRRVMRAIEIALAPPVEVKTKEERPFQCVNVLLNMPRTELYDRINQRVDIMMKDGLLEEVRSVLPFKDLNALQTVGYRELFDHLEGLISLETAVDKIKQHTRNYAKRQLTWFKNQGEFTEVQNDKNALKRIQALVKKAG